MKKRFTAFVFSAVMCLTGIIPATTAAASVIIPKDCEELTVGREYLLLPGEDRWFRFIAPTPYCYLTEQALKEKDGFLYGLPVDRHALYSASGEYLGVIGCTNDPEEGGWNEFLPGDAYYLNVKAGDKTQFFTFGAVLPEKSGTRVPARSEKRLELKETGVSRRIPGYMTGVWDVYTLTERFSGAPAGEVCASDFFAVPFEICFEDENMALTHGKVTYSAVEPFCADAAGSLRSYVPAPKGLGRGAPDGSFLYAANRFSYVAGGGEVSGVRSLDVLVPSGKRLTETEDGCFRAVSAGDLYSDVEPNSPYAAAVLDCAEKGFMSGMPGGVFSPGSALTRAQMVQILARICGADLDKYADKSRFSDVVPGAWYSAAVEWAAEAGVTAGVGGGTFSPDKPVTRQETAVFFKALSDAMGVRYIDPADISGYADASETADWAKAAAAWAAAAGILSGGDDNRLAPRARTTRAQTARTASDFAGELLRRNVPATHTGSYFLEGGTCGYGKYDEMIRLTGKDEGRILFIGYAAQDPLDGYSGIAGEFALRGFSADCLTTEDGRTGKAGEKIENADIIWVSGGDSRLLLYRLTEYGLDRLLRRAAESGTVMCGSSAGAICFGRYGTSGTGAERYINLKATGCLDAVICPHGFEEARTDSLKRFLAVNPALSGISLDGCALEIKDGLYRIYSEELFRSCAVKHRYADGSVISEDINSPEWRPLRELFG